MPTAFVVAIAHEDVDAAFGFDACDQRRDDVAATLATPFSQAEQNGGNRCRRMTMKTLLDVVEIERMGGAAIDQNG